jgi:hypothetical protein
MADRWFRTQDEIREELLHQIEESSGTGSESDLDSSKEVSELEDTLSDYTENEVDAESHTSDTDNDLQRKTVYGKNGCKWHTKPFCTKYTRTVAKNIVLRLPDPKGDAHGEMSEAKLLSLFITEDMLQKILIHTNEETECQKINYTTAQHYIIPTNVTELKAFIGLLYLRGVLKNSHLTTNDMWSENFGPPIFRCTMSKNRFQFLINSLRFNDKNSSQERRSTDKFAAFRKVWDMFISCKSNYMPSERVNR